MIKVKRNLLATNLEFPKFIDEDENNGGEDRRRLVTRTKTVVGGRTVW